MSIRRVVTTHDRSGKAVVLSDASAPNVRVRKESGIVSTLLWTTAESPAAYSDEDRGNAPVGVAPPPNGTVLRVVEFPPYHPAGEPVDRAAVIASMGLGHESGGRRPPRHEFMHATDSVDYAIVLEGEIDMLLDDADVHVRAGDIIVQQGTNHAWVNRGTAPCRIAFCLIGATSPAVASSTG